jgi:hypothetical protein
MLMFFSRLRSRRPHASAKVTTPVTQLLQPTTTRPQAGHDVLAVSWALIAEYNTLRAEIGRFQDHQKLIMQFAFAILVGLAAAVAAALDKGISPDSPSYARLYAFTLGFIAFVYFMLACLYAESIYRINVPARYIDSFLRGTFQGITGVEVWHWEQFLAIDRNGVSQRRDPTVHALLDRVQWMVFIGPALGCIVAFWAIPGLMSASIGRACLLASCLFLVLTLVLAAVTTEGRGVVVRSARHLP